MLARPRRVGTPDAEPERASVVGSDPHPWRLALLLTLLTIGLGMLASMVLVPLVAGYHGWLAPEDAWPSILAGQYVSNGAFGFVYSSSPFYVVSPLLALLLAPATLVADRFNLFYDYPYQIPHPTVWLVAGPYALALCLPLFVAARKLAHQVGLAAQAAIVQWASLILAAIPMAVLYGHFEDVLCLAALMFAVVLLLRERYLPAAIALGVAMACKQTAVLGLPLLIALAPKEQRVGMAVRSLAIPALFVALPLVRDWHHASEALFAAKSYPHPISHTAVWVLHPGDVVAGTPGRLVAVLFAAAVGWWMRDRREDVPLIMAAFGLVLLSRLVFEPRVLFYYLGPGLMFLLVHERLTTGHWWRTSAAGCLLMAYFHLHIAPLAWWPAAFVALAVIAWPAARDVARRSCEPRMGRKNKAALLAA
jgi:hypothetical protein